MRLVVSTGAFENQPLNVVPHFLFTREFWGAFCLCLCLHLPSVLIRIPLKANLLSWLLQKKKEKKKKEKPGQTDDEEAR